MHAMFSRRARAMSRHLQGALLEALESRVLLNGIDVGATWRWFGTTKEGTAILNSSGGITGGQLTDANGATSVPGGTYQLNSDHTIFLNGGYTGSVNLGSNVMALSNPTDNSLSILINPGSITHSAADFAGTWNFQANGPNRMTNAGGTITFDANGNVLSGSSTDQFGHKSIFSGGSFTVNANGTFNLTVLAPNGSGGSQSFIFNGAINAADDFMAADPSDLGSAIANGQTDLLALTKASGTFTKNDAATLFSVSGPGTSGSVLLDSVGHLVLGSITNSGGTFTLSGNASLDSKGYMTLHTTATGNGTSQNLTFTGSFNASKDVVALNTVKAGFGNNLLMLIPNGDHAPTFTKLNPFGTAIDTLPFTISYSQLLAASNATDPDGDPIAFQVDSIGSGGTLSLNGGAVGTLPALVHSGDTLVWTPNSNTTGNVAAFNIQASDGLVASGKDIAAKIKTVPLPSVTIKANRNIVSELTGTGQFTFARANGDKSQPLDVHYTISGTAVNGTNYNVATPLTGVATIPAGKPNVTINIVPANDGVATGNLTVTLSIDDNASYTKGAKTSDTVTIQDAAPSVSVVATRKTAPENVPGTTGQFTFTRTGDTSQQLVVTIDLGGTAVKGTNYFTSGGGNFGTVTFLAGSKTTSFSVVAMNDHIPENPNLNVVVTVIGSDVYSADPVKNQATVTIIDAG